MIIQSRRKFITGLVGLVAAPAVVKAASLMPVKSFSEELAREQLEKLISERLTAAQEMVMREMTRNLFSSSIYDMNSVMSSLIDSFGGDRKMLKDNRRSAVNNYLQHVEIGMPIKIVRG